MVSRVPNPALDAFVTRVSPEIIFAEVLITKVSEGFDVRHAADRDASTTRLVSVDHLREIAQFTEHQQFRPLKSAPTLQRGWRCLARNASELERALQCLYPGGIADWFATQNSNPPVTHYRDFAARQTGMYRLTTSLSDEQVAQVGHAGCHKRFCLKRRLWTVHGMGEDTSAKSLIPCLEPCAVLMEFARVVARIEQREEHNVPLTLDDLATIAKALDRLAEAPRANAYATDSSPKDDRLRAQWILERLKPLLEGR